ncbi:hypothetical protein CTT31_17690 [Pseudoalteromonas maricaloris]|uniref:hypothetical protein n=1 Tax=Pseudoalteromonas maricaloris TaxID=184924 RepID=UPI0021AD92EF|nr:hypothetical protein [Pseudoalteromonas flavipulchra]USE70854.1 hypothetical protein CTT31_17690 [Pseudoalteromonas flavipulchra]
MAGKKQNYKNKKFYYRRARWDKQGKKTLERVLIDAHKTLYTVGKRTFLASTGAEIRGASFKDDKGLYLQIASYVPGEATSIIDKSKRAKQSNVTAQPAPDGKDYLDGEVFVYVKGNHVILCPSGVRESVVETYFWHVLRAVDEKVIAQTFELDKVAKTNKLRMIKDEGVKEIDLNTSLYEASLIHMDRSRPKVGDWKKALANQFSAVFSKDKDLKEITEKENLNVKVTIKFDGLEARKHSKDPEFGKSGKKRLERTAEQVIQAFDEDEENGFIIVTGAGNRITSDEIRVSDSFRVETLGKSLNKNATWTKLKEYHDRLDSDGVFKQ